jgi:hypothetical protein
MCKRTRRRNHSRLDRSRSRSECKTWRREKTSARSVTARVTEVKSFGNAARCAYAGFVCNKDSQDGAGLRHSEEGDVRYAGRVGNKGP